MAGKLIATTLQVNDHATATNNFVLKADNAGGVKLSRGNDGATSSDILSVNSAGKVTLLDLTTPLQDGLPTFACRAWVNFDGTGASTSNQTIRGSGNIASVYKSTTGTYLVTFTTPMQDANYSIGGSLTANTGYGSPMVITSQLSDSFTVVSKDNGGAAVNIAYGILQIFR